MHANFRKHCQVEQFRILIEFLNLALSSLYSKFVINILFFTDIFVCMHALSGCLKTSNTIYCLCMHSQRRSANLSPFQHGSVYWAHGLSCHNVHLLTFLMIACILNDKINIDDVLVNMHHFVLLLHWCWDSVCISATGLDFINCPHIRSRCEYNKIYRLSALVLYQSQPHWDANQLVQNMEKEKETDCKINFWKKIWEIKELLEANIMK